MSAEAYNRARGYSRETWQRVQVVLGARPDGIPGPETVGAVKLWQSAQGLVVDGKVGPNTLDAFLADQAQWHKIEAVGVYCDLSPRWVVDRAHRLAPVLREHGIDHVQTMIDPSSGHEFAPDWSLRALEEWSQALAAHGITHGVTSWALPYPERMRDLRDSAEEYVLAASATRGELDCEEHLLERRVKLYAKDRVQLRADIVAILDAIRRASCPAWVSTYSDLFGSSDTFHASLVAAADGFSLQAYQTEGGDGGRYDRNGPGLKQHDGLMRYREQVAHRPLSCLEAVALALWDQDWSGAPPEQHQLLSAEVCVRSGVRRLDHWSLKHWLGPNAPKERRDYNSRYFKTLRALRMASG